MSGSRQPDQPLAGQPLVGRRVIITRSLADNRSLADALSSLGAEVIEVPLIEVQPPADGGVALRDAVTKLSSYRWVVLTSVNGVRALAQAIDGGSVPVETISVAPVGPITAAEAEVHGFTVAAAPPVATAEDLVTSFPGPEAGPGSGTGNRILAPLAELASDTVVAGLTALGYKVDRVAAYRTAAPVSAEDDDENLAGQLATADAATFFSPSAVDRFISRFGVSATPRSVICIGPSTAARAAEHNLAGIVTASPHTEAGVVAVLREVFD